MISSKLYSDCSRSNSRTTGCSSKLYSIYSDCSRPNSRTTGCSSKLLYHCKGAEDPLLLDEGQQYDVAEALHQAAHSSPTNAE